MNTRIKMTGIAIAVAFPLLVGTLLVYWMPQSPAQGLDFLLKSISASEAEKLEAVFDELNYAWPPASPEAGVVPAIAVRALPEDLANLSADRRKAIFFRILAPMVAYENRRLRQQREFLLATFDEYPALPESGPVAARVKLLASRFNVGGDLDRPANRRALLRRVDIIPPALVLAQAANESAWGTSRFAREANNLFGMWTWDEEAGLLPRQRKQNATHFVRVFDDLHGAVENYLHTINVAPAYRNLRDLRQEQRARNEEPDALVLAAGLSRYSERGEEYVKEIRAMIRYNNLQEIPALSIEVPDGSPDKN